MLTETLRQYFQKLTPAEIDKTVLDCPFSFINELDASKKRQSIISDRTDIINDEIERLCLTHNPSELIDEFVDIICSANFPCKTVKPDEVFYRARLGKKIIRGAVDDCDVCFTLPYYGKEIGKPPALMTNGGRFNRAGQSFLYLSSNVKTAIAEVHLAVGQECSVGTFKCVKAIDLIDLSPNLPNATHESSLIIDFWRNFLLQPVYSGTTYKYLLTQFITDVILKAGVAGIYFDSIQAKGSNIVCFCDDRFELVKFSEKLYWAEKIEYEIKEVQDGVRKWCYSPDYRSISSLNLDEEDRHEKEIEFLIEWIKNERKNQGIDS